MMPMVIALVAGLSLALTHAAAPRLTFLDKVPRSRWLSAAGGVSSAYVFVHLLPELAHHQSETIPGVELSRAEAEIFAVVLLGFTTFYGLERWAREHDAVDDRRRDMPPASFRLHVGMFVVYNFLVGHLLLERIEKDGLTEIVVYTVAMVLHFVVNDRGLYADHGARYLSVGRWALAAAPLAGLAAAGVAELSDLARSFVLAFLGGGIILNVMKEELPEERESRFPAFAVGAVANASLLFFFV